VKTCLNLTSLGTTFVFGIDRVFSLYRLNQQIFPTLGIYLMFGLYRI